MAVSPAFLKVRDGANPRADRTQDNIGATLEPIAEALLKTPIMGAMPVWTAPNLLADFVNITTVIAGITSAVAGYYLDSLNRVWLKGAIYSAAGQAAGTNILQMPVGLRPRETHTFPVKGSGTAIAFLNLDATGFLTNLTVVGAGGSLDLNLTYLAEV